MISFDPEKHEYSVDGIVRPSVTQIIRAAGLMENEQFYSDESRARGTAVHQACQYLDENDLDEQWLADSPLAGYVRAWMRFKEESRCRIELIEHRVFHPQYGYCGTLDRTATIGMARLLIDIKTGQQEEWHAVQSAGYSMCFAHSRAIRRMTVHVREDGTYSVIERPMSEFTDDSQDFLAAARIWRRKNRRNLGSSRSDRNAA